VRDKPKWNVHPGPQIASPVVINVLTASIADAYWFLPVEHARQLSLYLTPKHPASCLALVTITPSRIRAM
jgi:hypothetical protein